MKSSTARSPIEESDDFLSRVRVALVITTILAIPFSLKYALLIEIHSPHFPNIWLGASTFGVLEVLSALFLIGALPLLLRRSTYHGHPIGLIGALVFVAVTAILTVRVPSAEGVLRTIRLAGVVGLIASVGTMSIRTFRIAVVWPWTISLLIQSTWALLQTLIWHSGETSGVTERWADAWTQGHGSMAGGYALAAFVILGMSIIVAHNAFERLHPVMWGAIGLGSASLSTTFGRSGVLAAIAIGTILGVSWIITRRRVDLVSSMVVLVPMTIGGMVTWDGWRVRATETANGFLSNRDLLMERAIEMIRSHALLGVGPGRYGPALAQMGLREIDTLPVHSVPVLVTAEYGIPLGIIFTGWLVAVGILAITRSIWSAAVFVSILPYLIFDHPHISFAFGMIQLGMWLAVLDFHGATAAQPSSAGRDSPVHATAI